MKALLTIALISLILTVLGIAVLIYAAFALPALIVPICWIIVVLFATFSLSMLIAVALRCLQYEEMI